MFEVQRIYPEEFAIGEQGRKLLNETLGQEFPLDEAGNIAFHIVNARNQEQDSSSGFQIVEMIKDILNICQYHFHTEVDVGSLAYSRLIIHLEFFAKRILRQGTAGRLGSKPAGDDSEAMPTGISMCGKN